LRSAKYSPVDKRHAQAHPDLVFSRRYVTGYPYQGKGGGGGLALQPMVNHRNFVEA